VDNKLTPPPPLSITPLVPPPRRYFRDGHQYAPASAPHPDLLPVKGDVIIEADGTSTALVIGADSGSVAAKAARAGRLVAAHNCVWQAEGGVAALWAGVCVPKGGAGAAAAAAAPVRGSLTAQGATTLPLTTARAGAAAPKRVIAVGGVDVKAAFGEKAAAMWDARIKASGAALVTAATDGDAEKLLGLA
jgi:hypothetical protein